MADDKGKSDDSKSVVSKIAIKRLTITADIPSAQVPVLIPESISFEVMHAESSICNALRRVIMAGIPTKGLHIGVSDLYTNNPFILWDYVQLRLKQIPINQEIPLGARFVLNETGTDTPISHILSGSFKPVPMAGQTIPKPYFNPMHEICTLETGQTLTINASVKQHTGNEDMNFVVAHNVYSIALDEVPIDKSTNKGISSSVSKSMHHRIGFITHGTMSATDVVIRACKILHARLTGVLDAITDENIKTLKGYAESLNSLILYGEDYTIGVAIMATIIHRHSIMTTCKDHGDSIVLTLYAPKDKCIDALRKSVAHIIDIIMSISVAFNDHK